MKIIKINLKENPYSVYVGYNLIKKLSQYLKVLDLGNFAVVITSPGIERKYRKLIKRAFGAIPYKVVETADGEQAKSKEWLFKVINEIVKSDSWNKRIFIVCFGGGTIGDAGGFAASIYKRGTPYIQVPTTLLSQIDASVGGKTAINLNEAKNILGAYYQPKAVFIDPAFLNTLGVKEIKEGLAEAIKYAIIKQPEFFYFLKRNREKIMQLKPKLLLKLIYTCVKIKARVVEEDEKEKKGIRTILNFGHTLAHALEASKQYRNLSHGEAVSLGMLYAAELSCLLRLCSAGTVKKIHDLLCAYGLPTTIPFDYLRIYKTMGYDKKFISGKARLVLLRHIGKVAVVNNISSEKILESLQVFTSA